MTDHTKLEAAARALVNIYDTAPDLGETRIRLRILEIIGFDIRAALKGCGFCEGTGKTFLARATCPYCKGSGVEPDQQERLK